MPSSSLLERVTFNMSLPASVYRRDQRNANKVRQSEEEDNRRRQGAAEDDFAKLERERKAKLEAAMARTVEETAENAAARIAQERENADRRARVQRDYSRYLEYTKRSPVFAPNPTKTNLTFDDIVKKYELGHEVEFARCGHRYCVQTGSELHKQIDAFNEDPDKLLDVHYPTYIVVRPNIDDETWKRLEKRYRGYAFIASNSGCRFCAKWLAQARDPPPTVFDISPYDRVAEIYFAFRGDCPWRLNREDLAKWFEVNDDIYQYWFVTDRRVAADYNFYNFLYGDYRLPLSFLEWAGVISGKITLEQVAEKRDVEVKQLLRPRF